VTTSGSDVTPQMDGMSFTSNELPRLQSPMPEDRAEPKTSLQIKNLKNVPPPSRNRVVLASSSSSSPSAFLGNLTNIDATIGEEVARTERLQDRAPRLFRRLKPNDDVLVLKTMSFQRNWMVIGLSFSALGLSILSSIYWTEVLSAKIQSMLWDDPSKTLFTVSCLSTITFVLLHELVIFACNNLRWSMCARKEGISILDFMALGNITPWPLLWPLSVFCRPSKLRPRAKLRKASFLFIACLRFVP
jgi:hypothetical protein